MSSQPERFPRYEIWQGADLQWYARVRASNGRILASSQGYTRHRDALRCVQLIAGGVVHRLLTGVTVSPRTDDLEVRELDMDTDLQHATYSEYLDTETDDPLDPE